MKSYFSVSEAAEIVHMTSEALRHYDRIGLVKPSRREESTGYRAYSSQDLVRLHTIHALRCMDLSLREIREVLSYDDLEQIVAFLKQMEGKADEKIAELQFSKAKIQTARAAYEKKLPGRPSAREAFVQECPARVILLSDTMEAPTLDNLFNYLRHFYDQVPSSLRELFAFEDAAGVYTKGGRSRLYAVCIRSVETAGLTVLPAGRYLCADCDEEDREPVLDRLMRTARERTGAEPAFSLQRIVVSGILQWTYQIQIPLET